MKRIFRLRIGALSLSLLYAACGTAHADSIFNTANGNWTNAANWSPNGVPSGGNAQINNGDTATYTGGGPTVGGYIWLGNGSAGTLTINSGSLTNTAPFSNYGFTVGENVGGTGNLILGAGAGTLSVSPFVIGRDSASANVTQNGGTVLVSDFMSMGLFGSGGTATYNMNGGTLNVGGDMTVDETENTTCSFVQTGGTVLLHTVHIGRSGVGGGIYNISGGTLSATLGGDLRVGADNSGANGTLTVSGTGNVLVGGVFALAIGQVSGATGTVNQNGGSVTLANNSTFGVWLAPGGGTAKGTYNLNGGTLTTDAITPVAAAAEAFNFGGGSLKANANFTVNTANNFTTALNAGGGTIDTAGFNITWNPNLTGAGSLNKVGAGTLTVTNALYTGLTTVNAGTVQVNGTMTGTGGATVNAGGVLNIINAYTNASTVTVSGGSLTVLNGPFMVGGATAGQNGTLIINNSGTVTAATGNSNNRFIVGGGAIGNVNMANGAVVAGNFTMGQDGGTGSMVQSNGTVTANGFFSMGLGSTPGTGSATYQMLGGTFTANSDFSVNEAKNQTCIFTQAAGTVVLNDVANGIEEIGRSTTGLGQYDISGGLFSNVAAILFVGGPIAGQNGVLNISGSGNVVDRTNLVIAGGGTGALNVSGGSLTTYSFEIGRSTGTGIVTQNNGTVVVQNFFTMGTLGGTGSGTYQMNGGTLTVGGDFSVNESNSVTSTFNQAGGTVNLNGFSFLIGRSPNGQGVYSISGGTLNTGNNGDLQIAGIFNPNANGVLNISGSANVNVGGVGSIMALAVGRSSNGTAVVNQSGGTVLVQPTSTLGVWLGPGGVSGAAASATYNLNGGTLITPQITADGGSAIKQFNFGGGTLRATNNFTVSSAPNFTSTINSGGGTIDTGNFNVNWNTSLGGAGALQKNGTGILTLNSNNTYNGGTTVNGGTLAVDNTTGSGTGSGTVQVNSGATVAGTGTVSGAVMIASGGTLSATAGGRLTLNSSLANSGIVTANNSGLIVSGNFTNNGNVAFVGSAGTFSSPIVRNQGNVFLSASTLNAASAVFTNATTGVINLNGSKIVDKDLVNQGRLTSTGGLISNALVNALGGFINVVSGVTTATPDLVNFGVITNNATLQMGSTGAGTVTNAGSIIMNNGTLLSGLITNTGTIAGTGTISGPTLNSGLVGATNGQLRLLAAASGAGAYSAVAGASAATLTFAGGGSISTLFDTSATIRVEGTLTNAAGSFANAGTLTVVGGTYVNSGGFQNGAGSVLSANGGQVTVGGVLTNAGTVSFANSVGTFNSAVVNSGAWITDPTTNVFNNTYTVTSSGYISASAGDVYVFSNGASSAASFVNLSTNKTQYNTLGATFTFDNTLGLTQDFYVAGHDMGPGVGAAVPPNATNAVQFGQPGDPIYGFSNNFALATLQISAFTTVRVDDAFLGMAGLGTNDNLTAGLYVNNLLMGLDSLLIISSNVEVYFESSNTWGAANYQLTGNPAYDNTLSGLHQLEVVPEPSILMLFSVGAIAIMRFRRRKQ